MARKKTKKKIEFSKVILALIMTTYFIVDFFVGVVIWNMVNAGVYAYLSAPVSAFLTFNSAVVSVAVGYYLWKAKNENQIKIKNNIKTIMDEGGSL